MSEAQRGKNLYILGIILNKTNTLTENILLYICPYVYCVRFYRQLCEVIFFRLHLLVLNFLFRHIPGYTSILFQTKTLCIVSCSPLLLVNEQYPFLTAAGLGLNLLSLSQTLILMLYDTIRSEKPLNTCPDSSTKLYGSKLPNQAHFGFPYIILHIHLLYESYLL